MHGGEQAHPRPEPEVTPHASRTSPETRHPTALASQVRWAESATVVVKAALPRVHPWPRRPTALECFPQMGDGAGQDARYLHLRDA